MFGLGFAKKSSARCTFHHYVVQIFDKCISARFIARVCNSILATSLLCAPVLAGPQAFDLKPLRDASLAIERQRIADLEVRGGFSDTKTKEAVERFLLEMHFLNPTKEAVVYPSEERLLKLRALVESEALFDENIKEMFGIQLGSGTVKSHSIMGRFTIRFPYFFDNASGSVLPSTQRLIQSEARGLEFNAGPGLPGRYRPDLVPVLGNPPSARKMVNPSSEEFQKAKEIHDKAKEKALVEQFSFNRSASTLQFPMGAPGFDGGVHTVSHLEGEKESLVFVLPDDTTDNTFENWPRDYWIQHTISGRSDIASRDDRLWQRPRGQLRSYVQHFSTRTGWRLTLGQPGKFLYYSTRLAKPLDWILDPNFDIRSTPMQFLFRGDVAKTEANKEESLRQYVMAHTYQTQTQLTYHGKKGRWRLFYQPIYDPTQEISANAQIPKMRGQWVVHYRPFADNDTGRQDSQILGTSQNNTLDQVFSILNTASKTTSIRADYRARGFDTRLEEPASNSPPRILYQLIHPALKEYDSDDIPSSALLIEPSCVWQTIKSRSKKWKNTVQSVCNGQRARVTASLVFKDHSPGHCLKASQLKQAISRQHTISIVKDFYRNKSFYFPLVWAPTYRGGPGDWELPASSQASGKAPPIFQNDLDMRQWPIASAAEKYDVISGINPRNRLLLGLWVRDDCVQLLQFMKSI
jgi:hypothetical protein